jgi:hypothetical protein
MSPCRGFTIDITTDDTERNSVGDLLVSLGGISSARVRCDPALGTATVDDVIRVRDQTRRICELVDGTLVEKIVGAAESFIALRSRFGYRRGTASAGTSG